MSRPRIFIGLQEVADYYSQLYDGFEQLGYDVVLVNLRPHPFYGMVSRGRVPLVARIAMKSVERSVRSPRRQPNGFAWRVAARLLRIPLLLWALATRDVFIFAFGSTFFDCRDLPLLKLFGKRTVVIFHGSDSRPPYLNGALVRPDGAMSVEAIVELTRKKKQRVRKIDRWADIVVDNPLSAHFHERPVISFLAIGVPRATPRLQQPTGGSEVRVLHSPSNPAAKGTRAIRAAVEGLRRRGLAVNLTELSGVSHSRVIAAVMDADVIVDQLYSDVALAGFAAEAAAAGRPVVVGGYGRDAIEEALCGRPFPPVSFCSPDDLEATLELLINDEQLRQQLGRSARDYVEAELTPAAVASRLLEAIDGGKPEWLFDPRQIRYVHGVGLTESEVQAVVRVTVARGGVAALCVGDKPDLEARLLEFSGIASAEVL